MRQPRVVRVPAEGLDGRIEQVLVPGLPSAGQQAGDVSFEQGARIDAQQRRIPQRLVQRLERGGFVLEPRGRAAMERLEQGGRDVIGGGQRRLGFAGRNLGLGGGRRAVGGRGRVGRRGLCGCLGRCLRPIAPRDPLQCLVERRAQGLEALRLGFDVDLLELARVGAAQCALVEVLRLVDTQRREEGRQRAHGRGPPSRNAALSSWSRMSRSTLWPGWMRRVSCVASSCSKRRIWRPSHSRSSPRDCS